MNPDQPATDRASDASTESLRRSYEHGPYQSQVHSTDPHAQDVLAGMRARKLQPLIGPDDTVFEFGVGTALNLRHLRCRRKVGHDLSDVSQACCQQHGIEFVRDLADMKDQKFSVVLCHHTLEHVPDPFETLGRLKVMLEPGGRLLLFVPYEFNRRYRRYWPGDPNHHLFSWNALTCGNLVAAAGLDVEQVKLRPYGYQQRLAPLAKWGMPLYHAALWVAGRLRPCDEIQIVARAQRERPEPQMQTDAHG